MKKAKDWKRKSQKRKIEQQSNRVIDFVKIINHFFKNFSMWINEMSDGRHQSYIKYSQADYLYMGIMKNVCGIESMCQMEEKFNTEECINTLKLISENEELDEMPNMGSLNFYLEKLSPSNLRELRKKMIKTLIRNKTFYKERLLNKYWKVIIDGTGLFSFKEKHCENCLVTTRINEDGKKVKRYYHKVLEAKLVLAPNIVISLDTEFIENENENVEKQDCEINAAKRLLKRLKKDYPRLPIVIQGDALYAAETIMEICKINNWKYIFTQKEERQQLIEESYEYIKEEENNEKEIEIGKEKGMSNYVNSVDKVAGKKEKINVYEYNYTKKGKKINFKWITNIEISNRNILELIKTARGRWKIENEGFNNQKCGIYKIEHLNSRNNNAMKNHYLLTQISDILMQLYLVSDKVKRELKESIKNTSSMLLECFRRQLITKEDVQETRRYTKVYLE